VAGFCQLWSVEKSIANESVLDGRYVVFGDGKGTAKIVRWSTWVSRKEFGGGEEGGGEGV